MAEVRMHGPAARFVFQGGTEARRAAGAAFGPAFPADPCRAHAGGGRAALWLGPDEYLLLAPTADAEIIATELAAALAGLPHSLVDVGHRQVAIRVSGAGASDILNSGCPLDFDLAAFPPGSCTRTLLAKAEIVLWRKDATEYHLETGRSYADYVLAWLHEAGR